MAITLTPGQQSQLQVQRVEGPVVPVSATVINWTSSNPDVASISAHSSGNPVVLVTAHKVGSAVITCDVGWPTMMQSLKETVSVYQPEYFKLVVGTGLQPTPPTTTTTTSGGGASSMSSG